MISEQILFFPFLSWAIRIVFRIWKTGANGVSLSSAEMLMALIVSLIT